ncbi:MAG: glycosyltransferase, partial [Chloroflexota bacterium]
TRRESVRLFIVGAGRGRSDLEKQAAALGIDAYVIFTGCLARRKLIDLYKQALFVFPSTTETQGMVLTEAMMAGSPVVAVGRMGVLDIIQPGETGILVEEDEEEFARACLRLLDDRVERERMGRAATAWARRYSAQASTERLLQIYTAAGTCESDTIASQPQSV